MKYAHAVFAILYAGLATFWLYWIRVDFQRGEWWWLAADLLCFFFCSVWGLRATRKALDLWLDKKP